jgi:hypothetical protein
MDFRGRFAGAPKGVVVVGFIGSISASPSRVAAIFADPDWRGDDGRDGGEAEAVLRPYASILAQEQRLAGWIRGGADYGWLNAYQARRAAFDLESIRAQAARELRGCVAGLADEARRAVQSRLDRLEVFLNAARLASAERHWLD